MSYCYRIGRKPIIYGTCIIQLICRVVAVFVVDYYYVMLVMVAVGSSFTPLGFRIGVTLGKSSLYFVNTNNC